MASLPFIPLYRYNLSILIWFLLKNKKLRYQAFGAFYRNFKQSSAWSLFAVSNFCHVQINGLQIKKWRGVKALSVHTNLTCSIVHISTKRFLWYTLIVTIARWAQFLMLLLWNIYVRIHVHMCVFDGSFRFRFCWILVYFITTTL